MKSMGNNNGGRQIVYACNMKVNEASTFTVQGNCLDSACSPIRLCNGQKLKVREVERFNPYGDIEKVQGKVCCIQYIHNGSTYFVAKEIVGIDEITDRLRLRFYNPEQTDVFLKIKELQGVWVVEGVKE